MQNTVIASSFLDKVGMDSEEASPALLNSFIPFGIGPILVCSFLPRIPRALFAGALFHHSDH